jgi:hypothetical protein
MNFNFGQGKQLNETQHAEELKKYSEYLNNKTRIHYSSIPTMDQVMQDLKETGEVVFTLKDGSVVRVVKKEVAGMKIERDDEDDIEIIYGTTTWCIYVNDSRIDIHGTSMRDEELRKEETWWHDTKNDDWIRPTTVRYTGEDLFIRTLQQIIDFY